MRLLHLADVHLGASYAAFGDLAAARAEEVLQAFRRVPEIAAEERVHAVLIGGDLFDGPQPAADALAAARDVLSRFVDLCIPVFMVPGTHDSVTLKLSPYRELASTPRVVVQNGTENGGRKRLPPDELGRRLVEKHSAYLLTRPRFGDPVTVETDDGPLSVYGMAHDAAELTDPLGSFRRTERDGAHVVLIHAAVHRPGDWRTSGAGLDATMDELRALDVDYIALGEDHRPRPPEDFDGLPACYPGCFAATDLTETGPRGLMVVDLEAGSAPRVRFRESGVRAVASAEVDVGACEDDAAVAESAASAVPTDAIPVVRLVGEPGFPLDSDAVGAILRERFGHASVLDETRYFAPGRLDELARRDTVVGHVVRVGRERVERASTPEQREVAQRALRLALRALGSG